MGDIKYANNIKLNQNSIYKSIV